MIRFVNTAIKERFINDVLDIICRTKDGEATSYVIQELRYKGWVGLGSHNSEIESALEDLGFKLRIVHVKGTTNMHHATYITL